MPETSKTPGTAVPITVTDLVLPARPAHLPPQPAGIRLALMRADPIPLHFYRYLYRTVGERWLWVNRATLDDTALAALIHKPGVEVFVLYGDGAPAGFYELDFTALPTVDLVYFGLLPEWIGRRVGAWLLGTAISESFARGARAITVNTCDRDHPKALTLYQCMGFNAIGQRQDRLVIPNGFPRPKGMKSPYPPVS